jgi:hypothetical protein
MVKRNLAGPATGPANYQFWPKSQVEDLWAHSLGHILRPGPAIGVRHSWRLDWKSAGQLLAIEIVHHIQHTDTQTHKRNNYGHGQLAKKHATALYFAQFNRKSVRERSHSPLNHRWAKLPL